MISSSKLTLGTVGGYYLLENLFWADLTKFRYAKLSVLKSSNRNSNISFAVMIYDEYEKRMTMV
jgi:hypothetical protein